MKLESAEKEYVETPIFDASQSYCLQLNIKVMKKHSTLSLLIVFGLVALFGISSCKDSTDATVIVKVVEYQIDQQNPSDTLVSPVAQAQVRFYQDERVGTLWLEETIPTNSVGEVEFVFPNPAILKFDVTHGGRSSLENFVILESGETVEVEINLDEE